MLVPDWHTLYVNLVELGTGASAISVLEKIIRPAVVYLLLVFTLRRFGRRMLAQLNPFDFVVLLTLSNTVQNAIIGNDTSLLGGLVGAAALLGINTIIVRLYYRGTMEERVGEDDIYLVRDRKPDLKQLRRFHINLADLTARAHERGFDDLDEVESAVLYPNGTIYMKGDTSDSDRLRAIQQEVLALRQQLADATK
jgi:uncharacterized membrane protein YcaP (DUF421 family)